MFEINEGKTYIHFKQLLLYGAWQFKKNHNYIHIHMHVHAKSFTLNE